MSPEILKKPKLSGMMIELYGEEVAKVVYDRCQALDPILYVSKKYWARINCLKMR